jgi:hypothetical protein
LMNISKIITNESRKKSRENTVSVWYIYMKKSRFSINKILDVTKSNLLKIHE